MDILGTTKTIISKAGELSDLAKKVGDIDLYKQIVDFQGQIVHLSTLVFNMNGELLEAKAKITELQKSLKTSEEVVPGNHSYYLKDGSGPFCTGCYDLKHVLVRIHQSPMGMTFTCPGCKHLTKYPSPPKGLKPKQSQDDL